MSETQMAAFLRSATIEPSDELLESILDLVAQPPGSSVAPSPDGVGGLGLDEAVPLRPRHDAAPRRWLWLAVAAVVLVVALAAAVAIGSGDDATDVRSGPDDGAAPPGSVLVPIAAPELLDVIDASVSLRQALRTEMLLTAQTSGTTPPTIPDTLVVARQATDVEADRLTEAMAAAEPMVDAEGREAIERVRTRIDGLTTLRDSVDRPGTDPPTSLDQYGNVVGDVGWFGRTVWRSVDEPPMSRWLDERLNLARLADAQAMVASILTIPIERRGFVRWVALTETLPCLAPAADDPECDLYQSIQSAEESAAMAARGLQERATLATRTFLRDRPPLDPQFEELQAAVAEAGPSGPTTPWLNDVAAIDPDAAAATTAARVDGLATLEDDFATTRPR